MFVKPAQKINKDAELVKLAKFGGKYVECLDCDYLVNAIPPNAGDALIQGIVDIHKNLHKDHNVVVGDDLQ